MSKPSTPEDELRRKIRCLLGYCDVLKHECLFDSNRNEMQELDAVMAACRQYAAKQTAKALDNGVGVIYGIANDLANRDPKVVGSVPLDPYFANAVAIYSEFLKGDKYERIDWKALKLPTLERIKQLKEGM